MKFFWIFLILGFLDYGIYGYRILAPVSHYRIEAKRLENWPKNDSRTREFQLHLRETLIDAYIDNTNSIDWYNRGISESNFTAAIYGIRISRTKTQHFCGHLAASKPILKSGIYFKPSKLVPIPVANFTFQIPYRLFQSQGLKAPVISICYEGDSFLKIVDLETRRSDWTTFDKELVQFEIQNAYNGRCKIREILIGLDGSWNNRYRRDMDYRSLVVIHSDTVRKRITWDGDCDETKGMNQPCCLWKFHVTDPDGTPREFRRCFGSVPRESTKNTLIPEKLADLLSFGGLTRRFLSIENQVCRGIEFRPFYLRKPDGTVVKLNKLDTTKCAAFY
ncbi:hypothetical protein B9Z55_011529 [Caenorhabditis nigoni]|uniref:Uncharacterized protein n=1 Tax=Caenorhabditis nigoni TaxID=1611254 RepID=A0A2G5ULD5_9PELO|nr:hypothetical protein B9Z55_011529 [Caenorhabditis nigoni]